MKKIQLENDIFIYQFEANSDSLIGSNITAIFDDKDYLLIDTGYQSNMKEVKEDLKGFNCTHVINTHYHPDHTYGLYELDDVVKIGSSNYIKTLTFFDLLGESKLYPTIQVEDSLVYKFGNHTFIMTKNIGHSICGILIDMDEKYLFVGDDLLITNKGQAILPYLTLSNIKYPIQALEKIKNHSVNRILIPAHGIVLDDPLVIIEELDKRDKYYKFISEFNDIKEFEKSTGIKFKGRLTWHKHNIEVIR